MWWISIGTSAREGHIDQLTSSSNCTALTVQCPGHKLSPPKTRPNCSIVVKALNNQPEYNCFSPPPVVPHRQKWTHRSGSWSDLGSFCKYVKLWPSRDFVWRNNLLDQPSLRQLMWMTVLSWPSANPPPRPYPPSPHLVIVLLLVLLDTNQVFPR